MRLTKFTHACVRLENDGTALVIDPGARDNRFDVRPPIGRYPWRDNSGNTTNEFLAGDGPRRGGDRARATAR